MFPNSRAVEIIELAKEKGAFDAGCVTQGQDFVTVPKKKKKKKRSSLMSGLSLAFNRITAPAAALALYFFPEPAKAVVATAITTTIVVGGTASIVHLARDFERENEQDSSTVLQTGSDPEPSETEK